MKTVVFTLQVQNAQSQRKCQRTCTANFCVNYASELFMWRSFEQVEACSGLQSTCHVMRLMCLTLKSEFCETRLCL